MSKVVALDAALERITNGSSILLPGFLAVGMALKLMDGLARKGTGNLTVYVNDGGYDDRGVIQLIRTGQVRRLVTSHFGFSREISRRANAGELEVELIPQGTLVEQIRSGGAGLGGVLTPTGVGTMVAEGKPTVVIGSVTYLVEPAIKADVALLHAYAADRDGNLIYRRAARNFNPAMATAASLVIAEAEEILPVGALDPDRVETPGILVDFVVQA